MCGCVYCARVCHVDKEARVTAAIIAFQTHTEARSRYETGKWTGSGRVQTVRVSWPPQAPHTLHRGCHFPKPLS